MAPVWSVREGAAATQWKALFAQDKATGMYPAHFHKPGNFTHRRLPFAEARAGVAIMPELKSATAPRIRLKPWAG